MSETVRYTGKIKLLERINNETLEEQCERIAEENNYREFIGYYDNWQEVIMYKLYNKYVIHNDKVYEVLEQNYKDTEYDIFNARKNDDGTIDYDVMYYNGGCYFDEAIGHALDSMEED